MAAPFPEKDLRKAGENCSTLHRDSTCGAHFARRAVSILGFILTLFSSPPVSYSSIDLAYGVNLCGGNFKERPVYPNALDFSYYNSKNLNLIRIPFLWERLQPTLNEELDSAQVDSLDTVVQLATDLGMKIILDMHNYGAYNETPLNKDTVTSAAFANVWRQLAAHYSSNTTIQGYCLMNEPGLSASVWTTTAQQAIDAIRSVDTVHTIYIAYGVGQGQSVNTDSHGKLVYEAHIYFDANNNGKYEKDYEGEGATPTIGVDRVDAFLNWCIAHQVKGFIGEYGIPNNDPRWNTVLDNFLQYLKANGIGGTYWAGGHALGKNYSLGSDPVEDVDSPQMSILKNYTTETYSGNFSGDIFTYTGSTTTGNLAPGKKVFSSGDFNKKTSRWAAIDGSTSTPWVAGGGSVPTFIAVDLGRPCRVTSFVITHDSGHPTVDFKIQSSADGITFNDLVTVSGNTSAVTTHPITSATARYFRIYITNPGSDGMARINEFQIEGSNLATGH